MPPSDRQLGLGLLDMVDHFDRPGRSYADAVYAETKAYAHAFEGKTGKRIPRAGALAESGVGRAGAEWSIFAVEAKGPNACAKAEANILEAGAMARAELASASASAGPVVVKAALGLDTGVHIGPLEAEIKVFGCGLTVGTGLGVSFFGSELKLKLW